MRTVLTPTLAALFLIGCAGTDAPVGNNENGDNSNPNSAMNISSNSDPNGNPNSNPNGDPNADPNGDPNGNPNSSTNNANNSNNPPNNTSNNPPNNNAETEWRALVANAELSGDTSTWSVVVFDGTSASSTVPQAFGGGAVAVAASGDRGYVVDLDTGMAVVVDAERGTELETIDLGLTDIDSVSADGPTLVAASGDNASIAQYSAAGGGAGNPIAIPAATGGSTQFVRSVSIQGNLVAGVVEESAQFPTVPQLFVADVGSASLIDVDPTMDGPETLGLNGATRMDRLGNELFAVGTESDGILIFRADGATWVTDQTLTPSGTFSAGAQVDNVVMATDTTGVAFTYDDSFVAYTFDSSNGQATAIDGLAVPSGLIGGDASSDGTYFFVGDYGNRNDNLPWGVGIVDSDGNLLDHVETDESLPPTSIAALN